MPPHARPARDAVIVDAIRTPRGRGRPLGTSRPGALAGVHPQQLAAALFATLAERSGVPPRDVDDVVLGCVTASGEQGANLARHAVLSAGWPVTVPAMTLTRACGSGLEAIKVGAAAIMAGMSDVVVAGGVESMSRAPMGSDTAGVGGPEARSGVGDGGNVALRRRIRQVPQGISADVIATLEGFTRERIDGFACESQRRAGEALASRRFAKSVVAVRDPFTGEILLERDECPRPTTAEGLAALPPSFADLGASAVAALDAGGAAETLDALALRQVRDRIADGTSAEGKRLQAAAAEARAVSHVHSAGSSSGIADGAAMVLLTSAEYARSHGLHARARIRAYAVIGSDPVLMLTGPTSASLMALDRAGMTVGDIDLWEINEAFAVVPLKTMRDLGLDPGRVNVNGGAIALGHPLGATGTILVGTIVDELERRDLATGLVTLCTAGGQGVAAVIERI